MAHLTYGIELAAGPNSTVLTVVHSLIPILGLGGTGVHLFFVLSGFLLFRPFARALLHGDPLPSVRKFYLRRGLRVLPAYWASIVLLILFFEREFLQGGQVGNLVLHFAMLHNWSTFTRESIDGPYWSLAVEWQFYLVLPLIALLLLLLRWRSRLWIGSVVLVSLVAMSPLYAILGAWVRHRSARLFDHFSVLELGQFLAVFAAGMAAAVVYVMVKDDLGPPWIREHGGSIGKWGGGLALGFIGIYLAAEFAHVTLVTFDVLLFTVALGASYAGILLGTLLGWSSWGTVMSARPLRFVGGISYSMYLWNLPAYLFVIIPIARVFGNDVAMALAAIALTVVLLIPFSYLTYSVVELPFIAPRQREH
jgi:peptidoglycan/LPS O-acetylase OafA/YrhL